ncbi:hypothetical protein V2P20_02100 [Methylobacter sp. Wu1]|uniref:hypothetical protein n=1 Tax=Methylobacter sp. Wu1 TaxID=3119359 RepID=UPI002F95A22D
MKDSVDTSDRVRSHTLPTINRHIDREIEARVRRYVARSREDITRRIWELDREWDIERVLETNASALAFTGLFLGRKYDRRWFWLPTIVLPFGSGLNL